MLNNTGIMECTKEKITIGKYFMTFKIIQKYQP